MQEKDITDIIYRYKTGTASEQDKAFLESWYLQHQDQEEFRYELDSRLEDAEEIWGNLQKQSRKTKRFAAWPAVAAAVFVVVFGAAYLFVQQREGLNPFKQIAAQDVAPGGNKAILTLADGTKVSLTDAKKGEIADQAGVVLEKGEEGQIVYAVPAHEKTLKSIEFNTIETPRGGQFQIHLPDGSKIWLNAASSLKYPVCFEGAKERKVELKGEAYFEIAKDKTKPFIVESQSQSVKVLGTHFNINAYTDEASVKTTLLEGSIQVSSGLVTQQIRPGQQAILTNQHFNIISVDAQEATAWKKGNFEFDNADIQAVMRQLSRWYDIQVIYIGEIPKLHYSGCLPRNSNISVVLNMLKETGKINFKLDKKTITVSK